MKEQHKLQETHPNETAISELPSGEFKIMVIRMFSEVRRSVQKQSENFNRVIENIFKVSNRNHTAKEYLN